MESARRTEGLSEPPGKPADSEPPLRFGAQRRKVWECIGCGRIDDPQPCVGICRDRKTEYVLAADHDRALAVLEAVVRTIATTTPRPGEAERHWKALQARARGALRDLEEDGPPGA
jgi:hypothetical protein